jgi:hypothetical protein
VISGARETFYSYNEYVEELRPIEEGRKEGRKKERQTDRKECLSSSYAGHTVFWKLLA